MVGAALGDQRSINRRNRRKLTPRKRRRVFERDHYTCQECRWRQDPAELRAMQDRARDDDGKMLGRYLTIDHIIPECEGGTSELANLRTLCTTCNGAKGSRLPRVELLGV